MPIWNLATASGTARRMNISKMKMKNAGMMLLGSPMLGMVARAMFASRARVRRAIMMPSGRALGDLSDDHYHGMMSKYGLPLEIDVEAHIWDDAGYHFF